MIFTFDGDKYLNIEETLFHKVLYGIDQGSPAMLRLWETWETCGTSLIETKVSAEFPQSHGRPPERQSMGSHRFRARHGC